jgi:serine/threonine protein kinase
LVTKDGVPKITSFSHALGPAGVVGDTSRARENSLFLASYRAPEQVDGRFEEIGPATDVYGLGTILYKLLTGRTPFLGESVAETREQVLTQEPIPPSTVRSDIPGELELICLKCLRKHARDRYASADLLASDLEKFLANRNVPDRMGDERTEILVEPAGTAALTRGSADSSASGSNAAEAYITLEIDTEDGRGHPYTFNAANDRRIILGRAPECDLAVSHRAASRKHAMILYDHRKRWVLHDLESRGGTFVNGRRVAKATLTSGDYIGIVGVPILVRDMCPTRPTRGTSPVGAPRA